MEKQNKIVGTPHSVYAMEPIITDDLIKDVEEQHKRVEKVIIDLVEKVRLLQKKYGNEYVGGKPFQFILHDIEELGIKV